MVFRLAGLHKAIYKGFDTLVRGILEWKPAYKIAKELREKDLHFSNEAFSRDWNRTKAILEKFQDVKAVPEDVEISPRYYEKAAHVFRKRFNTVVKMKIWDNEEWDLIEKRIAIGHDIPVSKKVLEEYAREIFERNEQYKNQEFLGIEPEQYWESYYW